MSNELDCGKPRSCIFQKEKRERFTLPQSGGDGGIRTHVPRKANAFRVRPVMTTSIRLHILFTLIYYTITATFIQVLSWILCGFLAVPHGETATPHCKTGTIDAKKIVNYYTYIRRITNWAELIPKCSALQ